MSRAEREGFVSEHGTDWDVLVLLFLVLACVKSQQVFTRLVLSPKYKLIPKMFSSVLDTVL